MRTTQLQAIIALRQSSSLSAHLPMNTVNITVAIDGAANMVPLMVEDIFSESNQSAENGAKLPIPRKKRP